MAKWEGLWNGCVENLSLGFGSLAFDNALALPPTQKYAWNQFAYVGVAPVDHILCW